MTKVAIITMVQKADLPHAMASLASVGRTKGPDGLHIVLLNDTDDPALRRALSEAAGVEVIGGEGNLGVAGGRNRLVKAAQERGAEIVLSIDDDILVPPDFLSILVDEYQGLLASGERPGILTPATLDFHQVGDALFSAEQIKAIEGGTLVETPVTADLRLALGRRERRRAKDIYHMGIADWRGAYFFSPRDRALQAAYGVTPERHSGNDAHLRHARDAWRWILEGAAPRQVQTAPGGICLYSASLAEALGYCDEDFNPFGFEDADFALRALAVGYRNFCAPRAIAIHDIAARLSDRPVAALRATQGKMAGAFVRKHADRVDAFPAFIATAARALEQVTSPETSRREISDRLRTPRRLDALHAYFGNAFLYLLPPKPMAGDRLSLLDRVRQLAELSIPDSVSKLKRSEDDEFEFADDASRFRMSARRVCRGPGEDCVEIEISGLLVPPRYLPPLCEAVAGDGPLGAEFHAVLRAPAIDRLNIEQFELELESAAAISIAGPISRLLDAPKDPAPISISGVEIELIDGGALARLIELLAGVEQMTPKAYLEALEKLISASDLKAWLRGATRRLKFTVTGRIDGSPRSLTLDTAFSSPSESEPAPEVAALWTEPTAPTEVDEVNDTKSDIGPITMASGKSKFKSLIDRALADDPAVAPYPESYDPPKALRLARRARYYTAARGLPLTPNEAKLVSFRNRHSNERAFIIGNGPSLNLVDLSKLKNETTFGVNAIYLAEEKMGFLPTHHVVEDVFVAEDRAAEINALRGPHKWYGHYLRYCLDQTPGVCWLNIACDYRNYPGFPHFSTNASRIVWVGGTVSYISLQLAYHMGFDEVYLVGFDHSYSIPKEAKVEGRAITSTSDDPNHFHPGYFGKGYRWHDPRVDRMEKAYVNARRAYEAAGRRIYNATVGGHLEVFDRVDYNSLFK